MRTVSGLVLGGLMVLVAACATTPAAPPGFNVTGTWTGTWSYADPTVGSGDVRAVLEQEGDQVSGRADRR